MSLKIENETVYVIYKNGIPYDGDGRKLVYTSISAANGVITKEAKREAERNYDWMSPKFPGRPYWYELDSEYRNRTIEEEKNEFIIVEYGPKETKNANPNGQ
jgi:hypothetical protein